MEWVSVLCDPDHVQHTMSWHWLSTDMFCWSGFQCCVIRNTFSTLCRDTGCPLTCFLGVGFSVVWSWPRSAHYVVTLVVHWHVLLEWVSVLCDPEHVQHTMSWHWLSTDMFCWSGFQCFVIRNTFSTLCRDTGCPLTCFNGVGFSVVWSWPHSAHYVVTLVVHWHVLLEWVSVLCDPDHVQHTMSWHWLSTDMFCWSGFQCCVIRNTFSILCRDTCCPLTCFVGVGFSVVWSGTRSAHYVVTLVVHWHVLLEWVSVLCDPDHVQHTMSWHWLSTDMF